MIATSGITIVRDAVSLDFPVVEAIQSLLPLVDEMIVNIGRSDDGTEAMLRERLTDPRVRLLARDWTSGSDGGALLARETQVALDGARGDWAIYVQADEVLHEDGYPAIRAAVHEAHGDSRVQGLLVDFVHHYGDPGTIATARHWYRREVRVVRRGVGVRSHHEAQGFRVPSGRIHARRVAARYHHYGWCRAPFALQAKRQADFRIYGRKPPAPSPVTLPWEYGLRRFEGTHPAAAREWVEQHRHSGVPVGAPRWSARNLRLLASDVVERMTGVRVWEYRNYRLV